MYTKNAYFNMAAKKTERLTIAGLPEDLEDILTVYAVIQGRSVPQLASSLLTTKIQEKLPKFRERMEYLAAKRGLTYQEFFNQCLTGNYQRMSPTDLEDAQDDTQD